MLSFEHCSSWLYLTCSWILSMSPVNVSAYLNISNFIPSNLRPVESRASGRNFLHMDYLPLTVGRQTSLGTITWEMALVVTPYFTTGQSRTSATRSVSWGSDTTSQPTTTMDGTQILVRMETQPKSKWPTSMASLLRKLLEQEVTSLKITPRWSCSTMLISAFSWPSTLPSMVGCFKIGELPTVNVRAILSVQSENN